MSVVSYWWKALPETETLATWPCQCHQQVRVQSQVLASPASPPPTAETMTMLVL